MDINKHKLIKLSDTHYIVVDNSEIKPNSYIEHNKKIYWCTIVNSIELIVYKKDEYAGSFNPKDCFNVTYSTQPLETKPCRCRYGSFMTSSHPCRKECEHPKLCYDKIKPLSLSKVQEAIYGYSVEKMADNQLGNNLAPAVGAYEAYIRGFNAHRELVKDKLFTIEDIVKPFGEAFTKFINDGGVIGSSEEWVQWQNVVDWFPNYIQSLLPKTEWEIKEITPEGKIVLV